MNTSHLLDALLYVTGLAVSSVSGEVGTLVSGVEVEDVASATLRFDNGAIGSLMAGAHITGASSDECFTLYGTRGQVCLPDPYGSDPLRVYVQESWGNLVAGQWQSIPVEHAAVHRLAVEDFARAVQSKQKAPIGIEAARQVLATVLSIYRSAESKMSLPVS